MRMEKMTHCQQLYQSIMTELEMYRELTRNSACEASRKLRSVRASCKTHMYSKYPPSDTRLNCSTLSKSNQNSQRQDPTRTIISISVALNFFFVIIFVVRLLIKLNSCQIRRNKEKFVRESFHSELRQPPVRYEDTEEARNALLEAFELSRR